MKNRFYLCNILTILLFNPSIALNPTSQDENIAEFTCNLTKDIISTQPHTQDILIGNLVGINESAIINQLISCIGHDNPVVVTDIRSEIIENRLRKASVVILVVDYIDAVSRNQFVILGQSIPNYVSRHTGVSPNIRSVSQDFSKNTKNHQFSRTCP
jgi:hypothetical protein